MQISNMDIINAAIEYGIKGTTNKDIASNILQEYRGSPIIKDMIKAEAYAKVKNTGIDNKTRSYKDENGHIVLNDSLANTKSRTAKYRKSLLQKIDFALTKPFTVSCENNKYLEAWKEFLTPKTRAVLKRLSKEAINKGIGWIYTWIDKTGKLNIIDMASQTIYPAWADEAHTDLDAIVRDYMIKEYNNMNEKKVYKVEFWDKQIVEKYIDYSNAQGPTGDLVADTGNGEYELDSQEKEHISAIKQTHMIDGKGNGISWDKVPFIWLKGTDDELPLLNTCISDIDNYDLIKSKGLDSILDDIDAILVVKGIGAEMGDLANARKMVQNSRILAVDETGDADFKKVNADINAISQQLEILKKDIQDDTNTVDVTTIALGSNPSGKAMRTFYEPLNTWANGFEEEFRNMMYNLKYFFDKWLSWVGGYGTFEELQNIDIIFTLDRDMLIDETEIIDNIMKMTEELSQQTRDELNPYIDDPEKEEQRRQDDMKKLQEQNELMNLNEDIQNSRQNMNANSDNMENDRNNNAEPMRQ